MSEWTDERSTEPAEVVEADEKTELTPYRVRPEEPNVPAERENGGLSEVFSKKMSFFLGILCAAGALLVCTVIGGVIVHKMVQKQQGEPPVAIQQQDEQPAVKPQDVPDEPDPAVEQTKPEPEPVAETPSVETKEAKPYYLYDAKPVVSDEMYNPIKDVEDNRGHEYEKAIGGMYDEAYVVYAPEKQYTTFSGKLVSTLKENDTASIRVYGDDVLLYTSDEMDATSAAQDFRIDITDCDLIRIVWDLPDYVLHGDLLLVDAVFTSE